MNGSCDLLQNLNARVILVHERVVRIRELLGNEDVRILLCHTERSVEAFGDASADVARVVDEDDFRAVVVY